MITKTRKRENTKKTLGFLFVVSCFRFFVPALVAVGVAGISLASSSGPSFTNVTTSAGIRFKHNNGAFGKKYLPETMGSGVAFFDADGDGSPRWRRATRSIAITATVPSVT
jgi:hypothetical protein